ncbi:GntR family transcriptional regulator [Streptomyces umbrinus]|uniref:GntR family transcriptional regulator n=1 Tax=Streptomyces umbrinus TaxID=67370 RepID=UPI0033CF4797
MARDDSGSAPPVSRTTYVTDRIREDVARGIIQPGELIKQTVLAKRYGVSPTPVREALRLLEAEGVITYSPHRGATVRELTPDAARDLYRLRAAAESEAAAMAVERMTPAGLDSVRAAHREIAEAERGGTDSPERLSLLNRAFHFALYEQASPLVVQHIEALWVRFTPATTVWTPEHAAALQRDHDAILAAVESGNARHAAELTADHIRRAAAVRETEPNLRAAGEQEREPQLP